MKKKSAGREKIYFSRISFPNQWCGCGQTKDGLEFCPLHAAAPELLEAVKNMRHDLEIFYSKYREPNNKYYAALKKAVAKAEGRS